MFDNKKWLGRTATLLMSLGLLVGCSTTVDKPVEDTSKEDTEVVVEETEEQVEVLIDVYVDGEEQEDLSGLFEVEPGTTLLEVMNDNYDLDEEDGFVKSIEGIEQDEDAGKYWMFDINDEMGEVGASDYEVQQDDTIKWNLEAFEE